MSTKQQGRTVEGRTGVWLTEYDSHVGPQELAKQPGDWIAKHVTYSGQNMASHGWTRIGEARVEITLNDPNTILTEKVTALKAQKQNVLAEAEAKATEIERQIQTLLAITYSGGDA
jgi:hypothetical protein